MDERESNLFDRFYKSWRGIEVAYEKIASDCGVTTNVMYILTLLYKNCEPMTQNELSKELHLSKQTVTSVVDSLEKRGWVTPVSYTHLDVYKRQCRPHMRWKQIHR